MTLETFALATRRYLDIPDDALMRMVEMAALVSDALQVRGDVVSQRLMPGAGLCLIGSKLHPTVLADRSAIDALADDFLSIERVERVDDALSFLLGGSLPEDLWENLYVLPVAQGSRQNIPGTELLSAMSGRMGPHVQWGRGQQGFLTAGHVAQSVGAAVTDPHGAALGTVLWSNDPALSPSTVGDLDAALVSFASPHGASTGRSSVIAGAGEMLTVATTTQQAKVLGFFDHVRLGAAQACYAQCYATETKITQSGDSGGLVEARGDVAGMVIGAFVGRDMTMVQTVGYQLSEIRRRSGYMVTL